MNFEFRLKGAPAAMFAVCFVLFAIYRSIPFTPDELLTEAVSQHLLRTYNNNRLDELERIVAAGDNEAAERFTEQMVNARVEYDLIRARGPIIPHLSRRDTVVHLKYRIIAGDEVLQEKEEYLKFWRTIGSSWHYRMRSNRFFYLIYPF